MAQHPHSTEPKPAVAPAAQAMPPSVMSQAASPGLALRQQRLADLLASVRDIPSLNPLAGITSGPGNQGSACTAHLLGHAGTSDTFISIPRQLKQGAWGGKPQ